MEEKYRNDTKEELFEQWVNGDYEIEPTCARFGCGKKLSLQENLYGRYCLECSGSEKIVGKK